MILKEIELAESDSFGIEKYTFILKHEYVCKDGTKIPLTEPIVCTFANARSQMGDDPFFVNRMLEQYTQGILRELTKHTDTGVYFVDVDQFNRKRGMKRD